jgi:hypothetical protein
VEVLPDDRGSGSGDTVLGLIGEKVNIAPIDVGAHGDAVTLAVGLVEIRVKESNISRSLFRVYDILLLNAAFLISIVIISAPVVIISTTLLPLIHDLVDDSCDPTL